MFPQVAIHNPKKLLTLSEAKTQSIKTRPSQPVTPKIKPTPRIEVPHSADQFPFLQKPHQKIAALSGSTQIIDLTSNQPNENPFASRRTASTKKQKKLPVEEITVPLRTRTTAPEPTSHYQPRSKNAKHVSLTTSSRRSPSSKTPIQARLSTTKRPKNPNHEKTVEASEAAILERIGAHFKNDKEGRTLSPK